MTTILILATACASGRATGGAAAKTDSPRPTMPGPAAPTVQAAQDARADMMAARLTEAPERFVVRARLNTPHDEVWAYLSNHDNLVEYSAGLLQSADVDRRGSNGTDGVGATRTCSVGEDRFVEKVVFYRAPYTFAYSAVENTWGLDGHLAAVSLTPDGASTLLEWTVFFNTGDPSMAPMMSQNMEGMMRGRMLPYLAERFGGEVLPPS
jgi:hypothetical protein